MDYYNGTRFFEVGKDKYRRYTRGYIYGWNEEKEPDSHTDEFVILQSELSEIEEKKAELVSKAKVPKTGDTVVA